MNFSTQRASQRNFHPPSDEPMKFKITQHPLRSTAELIGPRLGTLTLPNRRPIKTPHFISLTSRGVVPHLSQDVVDRHTDINSVYVSLEDFLEKAPFAKPPIYNQPIKGDSTIADFISSHDGQITILGPRRVPPVECPAHNTSTAISTCTSVGFRTLENLDYAEAVRKLHPDLVVSMADLPLKPGTKRMSKMADRTLAWTQNLIGKLSNPAQDIKPSYIIAPILPIDDHQQSLYLEQLIAPDMKPCLSGLALYTPSSILAIPAEMADLPRFFLASPNNPHALLENIGLSIDVFAVPFVNEITESGIALTFSFPVPPPHDFRPAEAIPLAIDMWYMQYNTDGEPLVKNCQCYTCKSHHRAYINHLLKAGEMLAWTLLQIHNIHIMETFFEGVRQSIANQTFDRDLEIFARRYERDLPKGTGTLPTRRGYQTKSTRDSKKQPKSYNKLGDTVGNLSVRSTPLEGIDLSPAMFSMSDPDAEDTVNDVTSQTHGLFTRMDEEAADMDKKSGKID